MKYSLNITYRHRKTGIETKKTIVLSRGEESSLENILRITFNIPNDDGILLNCSDTIFYPVSMVNLDVAAYSAKCELQSFSIAAMNAQAQTAAPQAARPTKKSKTSKASSQNTAMAKEDKRKFNRGLDQRRSYLKEEKLFVMLMKDAGKSAEDISHLTGVSKSNVEKWCSDKIREKIVPKFKQESKNHFVDDLLRDSANSNNQKPLHFAVLTEPLKFKFLLEYLAGNLHAAQQNASTFIKDHSQIPPEIAFKVNYAELQLIGQSGRPPIAGLLNVDGLFNYVIEQGYFFNKKTGKPGVDHDSSSSVVGGDDVSVKNEPGYAQKYQYFQPLTGRNNISHNTVTSDESDMMELPVDDISVISSHWETKPQQRIGGGAGFDQQTADIPFDYTDFNLFESDFDTDNEDHNDEDDDDDEESDTLSYLMSGTGKEQLKNISSAQLALIRQGILPASKRTSVCNRPKTSEELFQLLREDHTRNMNEKKTSDFKMQYRHRYNLANQPVSEDHPEIVTSVPMVLPTQAERPILGNTRLLSDMRNHLTGKVMTEEEKEDMAVLTLLGE